MTIHPSLKALIGPLMLCLQGCGTEGTAVNMVEEILVTTDVGARQIDVEEYVTDVASAIPYRLVKLVPCDREGELQFEVTSEVVRIGDYLAVFAQQQEWEMFAPCSLASARKPKSVLYVNKDIDVETRTGTARVTGSLAWGRRKPCEVDFTLEFDAETGEATATEGDICGRDAVKANVEWVVPGFKNEHLLPPAP